MISHFLNFRVIRFILFQFTYYQFIIIMDFKIDSKGCSVRHLSKDQIFVGEIFINGSPIIEKRLIF